MPERPDHGSPITVVHDTEASAPAGKRLNEKMDKASPAETSETVSTNRSSL
jgi:hypothetical protein